MKDVMLTFDDCTDILDFWFSVDYEVTLIPEHEFNLRMDPKQQIRLALIETINKYEGLLQDCQTDLEKKVIIKAMESLKEQLAALDRGEEDGENNTQQTARDKAIKRQERMMKALKDIYTFYCKQHFKVGIHATFESIKKEQNVLNLGEFSFITKDFNLLKNKHDKFVRCLDPSFFYRNLLESSGDIQEMLRNKQGIGVF